VAHSALAPALPWEQDGGAAVAKQPDDGNP
jgi:hypothetical protein